MRRCRDALVAHPNQTNMRLQDASQLLPLPRSILLWSKDIEEMSSSSFDSSEIYRGFECRLGLGFAVEASKVGRVRRRLH